MLLSLVLLACQPVAEPPPPAAPEPPAAPGIRPYQTEGVRFISRCFEQGSSAILADEMGLGKTMQARPRPPGARVQSAMQPTAVVALHKTDS